MARLNRDQLLELARSEVREITVSEVKNRIDGGDDITVIDIRERDEWVQGHIPDASFLPRGHLELQIEQRQPDRSQPLVIYCAGGVRSLLAARNVQEMGYTDVYSLNGGFGGWKDAGLPFKIPTVLNDEQGIRYSRHTILDEIGEEGQIKLLDSKVLLIGAGGLGSPAAIYLAAAGVGQLGIIDFDNVDVSNLQRQVLHGASDVGRPKVESARDRIAEINPDVEVVGYREPITSHNAFDIMKGYDVVLNGSDNFPTRYLVNDACQMLGIPLVDASIFMFEGQVTVYLPKHIDPDSPCYRCLYPDPPPPGEVPSCAEAGVLGVLPGIVGSIQAIEAIKLIVGIGEPLSGKLLMIDTLDMTFRTLTVNRSPDCPVCGDDPTVTELIDYEQFCGMPSFDEHATENVAESFAETVAANGAGQPELVRA